MILHVLVFLVASFHFQDVRATNSTGMKEVNKNQKSEDECENFCMNDGQCSYDETSKRSYCICLQRYSGETCEIDECEYVCLNGGTCSWDETSNWPICKCPQGYSGERCETDDDCDCGPHGNCEYEECGHPGCSSKYCDCHPGYAELDGTCEVCNCGSDGTCHFEKGMKECVCDEGFYELHGLCEDFPSLSFWETWHETTYNINFLSPVNSGFKLLSVDAEIITKENEHFHYEVKANEDGDFVLEHRLADGRPQELRYRSETDMGLSRWREWPIVSDPQGHYPPRILNPGNGERVYPGSVLVQWEAPYPDDWVDFFEVNLTMVPEWSKYNVTNFWHNEGQRLYQTWVNAERENQDYKIRVRALSHGNASSEATVFFRTLTYGVPWEKPINRNLLIGVTVGGAILGVVFLSLCIWCCVKRSR